MQPGPEVPSDEPSNVRNEEEGEATANPEGKTGDETHLSFGERFALNFRDVIILSLVALFVGVWIYERGRRAYEGILGRPLRVGIVAWPGYAGGLVANNGLLPNKDSYFWNKHKLLVEFVIINNETELRADFINGKLDVIWSTVDSLAQQYPAFKEKGVEPRAFMQVDWSRGGDAIIASAGIERIEDLRGKRIAVSMSASQWLLESSLENSLTEQEMKEILKNRVTTKGSSEAGDLFANGSVDAAVLWEPDVTEALARRGGSKILVDTKVAGNLIADIMVAKAEFIRQRPDVISAFIDGWLIYGTTEANKDPMLAVKVLQSEADFEKLGEKKTQELLSKTEWATLDHNVAMFGLADGKAFFDQLFNRASRLWLKQGYIVEAVPAEQARDVGRLKEIYNARRSPPKPGCGPEIQTITLAVVFPPDKADLGEEPKRILDNQEALLMLQTHTGARFCVQAEPVEGDDPQRAPETSRARENAVIEYLSAHYNRPRSQFVSARADDMDVPVAGTATQYILIKLGQPRPPATNEAVRLFQSARN